MKILGIETSCDETAAAVVSGKAGNVKVLSNIVASQIAIHKQYGGVVPEVAAREHILNILPVIANALGSARLDLKQPKLDALAVTTGPGLITSLISGIETAKTLAFAWNIPIISVNHIEGHIYANFISAQKTQAKELTAKKSPSRKDIKFPAIVLTVSGGHTLLALLQGHGKLKTIGETRDDAAGEAFDKAAKMLKLGYPGGPLISAEAEKFFNSNLQFANSNKKNQAQIKNRQSLIEDQNLQITLPRPMLESANFDFSFSGLKTALRYSLEKDKNWQNRIPEYCAEFQQAVIDVLIHKTIHAAKKYQAQSIMLSGGVSANTELRRQFAQKITALLPAVPFFIPDLKYTTDNAAMVACAGYFKAQRREFTPWQNLRVNCNLEL